MSQIHATCVEIDSYGILITGPSGSGKSDLALRLIDNGAILVADDRTDLTLKNNHLYASSPPVIKGLLEVRGLGIIKFKALIESRILLVIDLTQPEKIERLPEPLTTNLMDLEFPLIKLAAFEGSSIAKVRLAVGVASESIIRHDD